MARCNRRILDRASGPADGGDEGVHSQIPAKMRVKIRKTVRSTGVPDGNDKPPQTQQQLENQLQEKSTVMLIGAVAGVDAKCRTKIIGHPDKQLGHRLGFTVGQQTEQVP